VVLCESRRGEDGQDEGGNEDNEIHVDVLMI
jgi:hypothetical protein